MGEIFAPGGIFSNGPKVGSFDDGKIYFENEQIGSYRNGNIYTYKSGIFSDSETKVGEYRDGCVYNEAYTIAKYGDGLIFCTGSWVTASQLATYKGNDEGAAAAYFVCIYLKELKIKKEKEDYEKWRNE